MTGKKIIYAFASSLVLALTACTNEDVDAIFNRTADGAIDLSVGVEATPQRRALTRAGEATPTYYALKEGTQIRLKVDGTWTGKTPEAISQKTTCTTVEAESGSTINALKFTEPEMLYWDDYGTGDPANKANTENGLKVLGVAVDGKVAAPKIETDAEWESKAWTVVTNGEDVLSGDIIVSNNLTGYKFAERNDDEAKKMIFKHPLSKITINLTAAEGFTKGTVGATHYKFEEDPTVTLTNATKLEDISNHANDYALTKGTVSIANANATSDGTKKTLVAGTTSTTDENITVIKQAVVYPGTQLGATDEAVIAVVQADGNIYYIRAKEIHDAITAKGGHTNYETLAGYNYIINVTVKKTGIVLTATVEDWNHVTSEEVHPVINVSTSVGGGNTMPTGANTFAFYRSESIDKGYNNDATPEMETDGKVDWTNTTTLYWSSHYQHYHFRGIYPANTVVKEEADGSQYVEVGNGDYDANTFPSNFVMGMPEIAAGTLCGNPDHEQVDMSIHGICAREAAINLNFRYMMSQVDVILTSSAEGAHDHVDLSNVMVELVNVYNDGRILMKDRSAVVTGDAGDFELPQVSTTDHQYLGVVVPQALTYTTSGAKTNLRFRITVTNSDNTKDIYYADVQPIKVKKNGSSETPATVDAWESGTHYVYNLKVTKTEIKVSASLAEWVPYEASQEVWF